MSAKALKTERELQGACENHIQPFDQNRKIQSASTGTAVKLKGNTKPVSTALLEGLVFIHCLNLSGLCGRSMIHFVNFNGILKSQRDFSLLQASFPELGAYN